MAGQSGGSRVGTGRVEECWSDNGKEGVIDQQFDKEIETLKKGILATYLHDGLYSLVKLIRNEWLCPEIGCAGQKKINWQWAIN